MHLCFAIPEYLPAPGGIATYYEHLAKLLCARGYQVTLLTVQNEVSASDIPNCTITNLQQEANQVRSQIALLYPKSWKLFIDTVPKALAIRNWLELHAAKNKIDVVCCADFLGWGAFFNEPHLPPVLVTAHGSYSQIAHHTPGTPETAELEAIKSLESVALLRADAVNAYSPLNTEFWKRILQRKIHFTTPPWTLSSFTNEAKSPSNATARKGLVAGRLQCWKGAEVLCQALEYLRQEQPDQAFHIDWYGGDTQVEGSAQTMSHFLSEKYPHVFNQSLHWHRPIDRDAIAQKQAEADYIIVPSTWDTFSFAALEALEKGKATILSNAVGASYLINNRQNGLIFESESPEALAEALLHMTHDSTDLETLGQKARATIENQFEADRVLSIHQHLLDQTVQNGNHTERQSILGPALSPILKGPFASDALIDNLQNIPIKNLLSGMSQKIQNKLQKN